MPQSSTTTSVTTIKKEAITFENNREAIAVFPPASVTGDEIASALRLQAPAAVLLIIGGAEGIDETVKPQLGQLFSRGIARAAADADAVIIDGGTRSGVMAMMGQGVADRGFKSSLIGVAPIGCVNYPGSSHTVSSDQAQLDFNHSHFVLVKGDAWGSELSTMYNLAEALMAKAPGMVILAGGGSNSKREALQAVRRKLPLVVIEGSGGVADMVASARLRNGSTPAADPEIAEIVEDGEIRLISLNSPIKGIEAQILTELSVKDSVLRQAWETFAEYDLNAVLQQKRFSRFQNSVLIIGVIGTALAVTMSVFAPRDTSGSLIIARFGPWWLVQKLLLVVPILLTLLITAASRFKHGNKWLLLRAGAEAIKQEIYRYRTRSTYYRQGFGNTELIPSPASPPSLPPSPTSTSAAQLLSQKLKDITQRTMGSDVRTSGLVPYDQNNGFPPYMAGGDDGFSRLTAERYIEVRLGDQLEYYKKKAVRLDRQLTTLQWSIWVIGGIATYLALVNQEAWIALTTSLVAALTSYLGYKRTEDTLAKFNEAKTELANVRGWWRGLSAEEQASPENIDTLIEHTEAVFKAELDGWVQLKPNLPSELRTGGRDMAER